MTALPHHKSSAFRTLRGISVLVAFLALAACGKSGTETPGKEAEAAGHSGKDEHAEAAEALTLSSEEAERAGVRVEEIRSQRVGESVAVTATIRPDQDRLARVAPRIEGRVISAPAKLGDLVRAGQTLATLDSVAVGESHAALAQAESDVRVAESDLKRAETLNAEEIIPRKDYLRAKAEHEKASAAARAAATRLTLLGGARAASGSGVSAFAVPAPFAGTVIEKKVTLGDLASPSEPIFTIADLSRVWIQADLPEAALAKVRIGAAAKVSVPAYPSETFSGRVTYIGAALDKDTRTVAARIEVPNQDGRLKPEMFATAVIEGSGEQREMLSVPDAAIVLMQGQPTVFVFEQGAYEMRVVEPGDRLGGRTVIKAGVKAGEQLVTAGAYALKARKLKSQLGHGH